jgi:organic hydroperoxide reductase OsmC/OhrA
MSAYYAKILWKRKDTDNFIDNKYSREHQWLFDGGAIIPASASPHIVPLPYSVEANVDPEEAFVASLSSCHMLFFLSIAAKKKFVVNEYFDRPVGIMEKNDEGKMAMTTVTLQVKVNFSDEKTPSFKQLEKMHHQSHDMCFIANSVKTNVVTEIIL